MIILVVIFLSVVVVEAVNCDCCQGTDKSNKQRSCDVHQIGHKFLLLFNLVFGIATTVLIPRRVGDVDRVTFSYYLDGVDCQ